MGRPRQYDEADAVEAASKVFRRRGYAATSVDHLVEATGMHRGSLYGAFGSKHGLFLRVVESAGSRAAGSPELLDVLLVALLELAPTDHRLRQRVSALISRSETTAEVLGRRLLARARLHDPENEGELE